MIAPVGYEHILVDIEPPIATVTLNRPKVLNALSPDLARRVLRGRSASLSVSGRNLKLWTSYLGTDPETAFNVTSPTDVPADFQTLAPPSYFAV